MHNSNGIKNLMLGGVFAVLVNVLLAMIELIIWIALCVLFALTILLLRKHYGEHNISKALWNKTTISPQLVIKKCAKYLPVDIAKLVCSYYVPPKIFDARLDKFDEWFTKEHVQIETWNNRSGDPRYGPKYILTPQINGERFTFIVPGRLGRGTACVVDFDEIDPQHTKPLLDNLRFLKNLPNIIGLKSRYEDPSIEFEDLKPRATIDLYNIGRGFGCNVNNQNELHIISLDLRVFVRGVIVWFTYNGVHRPDPA